jgi:hypothetical protein
MPTCEQRSMTSSTTLVLDLNVLMAYNNNNNIDKNPAISDLKDPG